MNQAERPHLPPALTALSAEQQKEIQAYTEQCVDHALHSVDRMLDAATHVISFLPEWLISRLAPKYIDPTLSARTAKKLTLKQAIKVRGALPADYLVASAVHMPIELTSAILLGLSDKNASQFLKHACNHEPALALMIGAAIKPKAGAKKLLRLIQIPQDKATALGNEALMHWHSVYDA